MILVDANLLIYAYVIGLRQHTAAQEWLDGRLNDRTIRVGLPWSSLLAFVRLTGSPRVFGARSTVTAAWEQVERWLELDSVWIPTPTDRHRQTLSRLPHRDERASRPCERRSSGGTRDRARPDAMQRRPRLRAILGVCRRENPLEP